MIYSICTQVWQAWMYSPQQIQLNVPESLSDPTFKVSTFFHLSTILTSNTICFAPNPMAKIKNHIFC